MKREVCIRCSLLYALSAPPILGWLIVRRIMHREGFSDAAAGLKARIADLEKKAKAAEAAIGGSPWKS